MPRPTNCRGTAAITWEARGSPAAPFEDACLDPCDAPLTEVQVATVGGHSYRGLVALAAALRAKHSDTTAAHPINATDHRLGVFCTSSSSGVSSVVGVTRRRRPQRQPVGTFLGATTRASALRIAGAGLTTSLLEMSLFVITTIAALSEGR